MATILPGDSEGGDDGDSKAATSSTTTTTKLGPATVELRAIRKNREGQEFYHSYDIWIDGKFHCTTRYSDFAFLNDLLKDDANYKQLPPFPPKKVNIGFGGLVTLKSKEVESRKDELERWIQGVFRQPAFLDASLVKKFFQDQRHYYLKVHSKNVSQVMYLPDDSPLSVGINTFFQTEKVLELGLMSLGVQPRNFKYFRLFEVPESGRETLLTESQHPYLVVRNITSMEETVAEESIKSKLYIKKWVFSIEPLDSLLSDSAALRIIYLQAVSDITKIRLAFPTPDQRSLLRKCQGENNQRKYVEVAHECNGYNNHYAAPCRCNFPKPHSWVQLALTLKGPLVWILKEDQQGLTGQEESKYFPWEKIRRWKYSDLDSTYSFQFCPGPEEEQWIILETEQYALINALVQETVTELKERMERAGHVFHKEKAQSPKEEEAAEENKKEEETKKTAVATAASTPAATDDHDDPLSSSAKAAPPTSGSGTGNNAGAKGGLQQKLSGLKSNIKNSASQLTSHSTKSSGGANTNVFSTDLYTDSDL